MAAISVPEIIAPSPPTPTTDDQENPSGLGISDSHLQASQASPPFNSNTLSPMSETFRLGASDRMSPALPLSPTSTGSLYSPMFAEGDSTSGRPSGENTSNPFNFQPMAMSTSPVVKANIGQRRGHKYKHSSISHQIFIEPPPRAPLALPNSLPIPTFRECRGSMSKDQKRRFWWSVCHMGVAGYTLWSAHGSLAMMALSHLILFDSLGALLCVVVDVLGNFEVWKKSSIRHPFGLERAEVLAGFALSVLLIFMGMDLISHNLQHVLEGLGHEPHVIHEHDRVSFGSVDMVSLLAITSSLVSAIGLKNHVRIGRAMRFTSMESLPSILSNPSHFLTISCSALLLLLPLLSVQLYVWLDRLLSGTIAISMCVLGVRLAKVLGSMLLMSYSGRGVSQVMGDIETDPSVTEVEDARFWQVHHGLCMGNIRLRVVGTEDTMLKLRERIMSLVRNRLGGGYGSGGQKWEVSVQMSLDNNKA